jgi:predicted NodU family carbamoyl transferase
METSYEGDVLFPEQHEAHKASAYYPLPFEKRVSRKKHDSRFPKNAINYCLTDYCISSRILQTTKGEIWSLTWSRLFEYNVSILEVYLI